MVCERARASGNKGQNPCVVLPMPLCQVDDSIGAGAPRRAAPAVAAVAAIPAVSAVAAVAAVPAVAAVAAGPGVAAVAAVAAVPAVAAVAGVPAVAAVAGVAAVTAAAGDAADRSVLCQVYEACRDASGHGASGVAGSAAATQRDSVRGQVLYREWELLVGHTVAPADRRPGKHLTSFERSLNSGAPLDARYTDISKARSGVQGPGSGGTLEVVSGGITIGAADEPTTVVTGVAGVLRQLRILLEAFGAAGARVPSPAAHAPMAASLGPIGKVNDGDGEIRLHVTPDTLNKVLVRFMLEAVDCIDADLVFHHNQIIQEMDVERACNMNLSSAYEAVLQRTGRFSSSNPGRKRAAGADGGEASRLNVLEAKLQRLADGGERRGGGGGSGGGSRAGGGGGSGKVGERARAPDQRMVPRRALATGEAQYCKDWQRGVCGTKRVTCGFLHKCWLCGSRSHGAGENKC